MGFLTINKLNDFENREKYRLISLFLESVFFGLTAPLETLYQGANLAPEVIGFLSLIGMLSMRLSSYMVCIHGYKLFNYLLIVKLLLLLALIGLYFDPKFIILMLVLGLFEANFFIALSIKIVSELAETSPGKIEKYQTSKNSVCAEGTILGSILYTGLSYSFSIQVVIICNIIVLTFVCVTMWKFKHFFK